MMRARYCLSILAALLLAACTPMALDVVPSPSSAVSSRVLLPGGTPVTVSLAMDVLPMEAVTLGTKADAFHEPGDGEGSLSEVKSVTLLQFRYPKPDPSAEPPVVSDPLLAELVGWQYIADYAAFTAENGDVTLVGSDSGYYNIVWAVANTNGRVPFVPDNGVDGPTTFGDFLRRQNFSQPLLSSSDEVWYTPDGGEDHYLRMNGSALLEDGIGMGTTVAMTLRRNCAKVTVRVTNNTRDKADGRKVVFDQVQLRDVNRKYYYLTDFPFTSAEDPAFRDYETFIPFDPQRFDSPLQDFTADQSANGASQTFTFYVPANERGALPAGVPQQNKNLSAPPGATRFCLYGHYGADRLVSYTYYLGADLTGDFNLKPNHSYTYDITLTEKGDASIDSRIADQGEVRLLTDANTYILNPPAQAGTITYALPVRRAAVFWNPYGMNMGIYGASDEDDTVDPLMEDTEWTAEILWMYKLTLNGVTVTDKSLLLPETAGKGFNPDNPGCVEGHQPFIRIKVPQGMRGSALVAIRVNGVIVWNWLLWITDYNPDQEMTPVTDQFIYPVPGGAIHRYNGNEWTAENAVYKTAFLMDRNLGALSSSGANYFDAQGFYFQYGRKDPFYGRGGYDNNNLTVPLTVTLAMHRPTTYFYRNFNVTDRKVLATAESVNFLDRRIKQHGGDYCEADKSVYDPCPPGWMIPPYAFNGGFTTSGDDNTRTVVYSSVNPNCGNTYYPKGYAARETTGSIFLPGTGYKHADRGFIYNSPEDYGDPTAMLWTLNGAVQSLRAVGVSLGQSYNVRCIRMR